MSPPMVSALRFGLHWSHPRRDLTLRPYSVPGVDGAPATHGVIYEPIANGKKRRGWVVLHGITRIGLDHPGLDRFARALASTGGRVLVPEIREWMGLDFAPERAQGIIRSAVRALAEDKDSLPGGVVLMGVSFGGPQALHAASSRDLRPYLRGVVSWGGYGDLERTFRFHFTGRHGFAGERYHQRPDPYGRWVVATNLIPLAPEFGDRKGTARALRKLAEMAGERRIDSWDPSYDPIKVELKRDLTRAERELFDLFAPPADQEPDAEAAEEVVRVLDNTARERMPLLDPFTEMAEIQAPARLMHGRSDHLIPFTETLALKEKLAPAAASGVKAHVTGFFAHSGTARQRSLGDGIREASGFVAALRDVFELE